MVPTPACWVSSNGSGAGHIRSMKTSGTAVATDQARTDAIDAEAKELIQRWQEGSLPEPEARNGIAELVCRSGVVEKVAASQNTPHAQIRIDLIDRLNHIVYGKIIAPKQSGFSLERAATASVCGWARELARAAVGRTYMRLIESRDRQPVREPDKLQQAANHAAHSGLAGIGGSSYTQMPVPAVLDEHDKVAEIDRYEDDVARACQTERHQLQARLLRKLVGIPPLSRPGSPKERRRILRMLDTDITLAHRSLQQWALLVDPTDDSWQQVTPDDTMDIGLLTLWDTLDVESARDLLSYQRLAARQKVVHELATAVCADLPRPSMGTIQAFKTTIGARSAVSGWKTLARRVAESFIASEAEPISRRDTMTRDRDTRYRAHALAARRLGSDISAAAAFRGNPLGRTRAEVKRELVQAAVGVGAFAPDWLISAAQRLGPVPYSGAIMRPRTDT